jgi:hypothetical protein
MSERRYTCACCGYRTFGDRPGSYEICHVCFWEDDLVQLLDPWYAGGANVPSLVTSQATFARAGAMEERFLPNVKGVLESDERDVQWRPVVGGDRAFVMIPRDLSDDEFDNLDHLYYWRRNAA